MSFVRFVVRSYFSLIRQLTTVQESLRKPRKLSSIVARALQSKITKLFVTLAILVVNSLSARGFLIR